MHDQPPIDSRVRVGDYDPDTRELNINLRESVTALALCLPPPPTFVLRARSA